MRCFQLKPTFLLPLLLYSLPLAFLSFFSTGPPAAHTRSRSRSRSRTRSPDAKRLAEAKTSPDAKRARAQSPPAARRRSPRRSRSRERSPRHDRTRRGDRDDDRVDRDDDRGDRDRDADRGRGGRSPSPMDPREAARLRGKTKEEPNPVLTRGGGAYIPPARLRRMQADIKDKNSKEYQRTLDLVAFDTTWGLKKTAGSGCF